jgi:hypothetical protein
MEELARAEKELTCVNRTCKSVAVFGIYVERCLISSISSQTLFNNSHMQESYLLGK